MGLSGNGQFNVPAGVAIDHLGNVFLVDWGNNRVQKFDNTGKFITGWGSYGSDNGQFDYLTFEMRKLYSRCEFTYSEYATKLSKAFLLSFSYR
jgi:hypothetical protein